MLKRQRLGRDVKEAEWKGRLRKEEHGKGAKRTIRSSEGQRSR